MTYNYIVPQDGDKKEEDGKTYMWVIRKLDDNCTIGEWEEQKPPPRYSFPYGYSGGC